AALGGGGGVGGVAGAQGGHGTKRLEWGPSRCAAPSNNNEPQRLYVRHLVHFGIGGRSHSSGSQSPIRRDLILAWPACARSCHREAHISLPEADVRSSVKRIA